MVIKPARTERLLKLRNKRNNLKGNNDNKNNENKSKKVDGKNKGGGAHKNKKFTPKDDPCSNPLRWGVFWSPGWSDTYTIKDQ
jgi:hypothetical protein